MENTERVDRGSGLGPRRGAAVRSGAPMSPSRAALLETVAAAPQPMTMAGLAALCGLHVNTVREHLEALEERGLVQRTAAAPHGRGRPAWLYRVVEPPDHSEYAGLATALAAAIHRTSQQPGEDAVAAGVDWGRDLARHQGGPATPGRPAARAQVVALFDGLGFGPEPDDRAAVVRLTRCPLLDAAKRYPDVVCGVHLGIARGALDEHGADGSRAQLFPFSETGACRLELMSRAGRTG